MATVVVYLGHALDRRTFDLFNWFRKTNSTQVAVIQTSHAFEQWLYPGAHCIHGLGIERLFDFARAKPNLHIVYLPFLEDQIEAIYAAHAQNTLPENINYLLPHPDDFVRANDKGLFTSIFSAHKLAVRAYSWAELQQEIPHAGVLAKPKIGKGAIGQIFIRNHTDLTKINGYDAYVFQKQLGHTHEVIGAFFLCKKGTIQAHYQHKRIRTYPKTGGVSVLSVIHHNPEVLEKGRAILKDLQWSGLAMIEFMQDPEDQQYYAIECNPRLWGTCLLGEFAGFGLIQLYIAQLSNTSMIGETKTLVQSCWQNNPNSDVGVQTTNPEATICWPFPYHLSALWKRDKNTCYIGISGAGFRAILFISLSLFSLKKWSTLRKKIFRQKIFRQKSSISTKH
ncbi:MAG: hypothetical protein O3B82_00135 [Bacteroidetes bacterium]|nr:hypothetical protein [Bacteroidota bacterium]